MSDIDEKIRELLNFSGFPFQHYCADKLANLDHFQVAVEVPYTHPSSNAALLGVHGAIDIIAAHPDAFADLLVCFIVECKKANDKVKNWILMPNRQQNPRWPTFFYTGYAPDDTLQLAVTRSVAFPELGYKHGDDFDYCINGIEVNITLTATNRDASEKVYNPLKQVVHGTRAFEAQSPKIVEGIDYFRRGQFQFGTTLYLPVVITTANIFVTDFPVEQVAQGEIPAGKLSLSKPKQWVTVEFPLPDYLGYRLKREEGTIAVSKRTVFIVNDQFIDEFFTKALEVGSLTDVPGS